MQILQATGFCAPGKPATFKTSASVEQQLKALKKYPGLTNVIQAARNLMKSLDAHRREDAIAMTMNRADAEQLDKLLELYYKKSTYTICIQMIGDELAQAHAVPLFMIYMNILTKEGKYFPKTGYKWECYRIMRDLLWNFTDRSTDLCIEVGKHGMLKLLLRDLKNFQKFFATDNVAHLIVRSAMGIFNNCSSVSGNIKYFQELNAVTVVGWYVKNTEKNLENYFTISSILTLSHIVDVESNDITASESILQILLNLLAKGLERPDGKYNSFSAVEITRSLTRLANSNKNSIRLAKMGFLNSLLKMMHGSDEDTFVATEAVWALAFSDINKKKIETFENGKIMELLGHFSESHSAELRKAANGVVWIIQVAKQTAVQQSQSMAKTRKGHVMISYQWDCQDTMIKIKDLLKSKGYTVWMDIDNMRGSILECMAEAIEKASVVLVCLSQKYKNSHNCRSEGEYTFRLRKRIIPVLVEEKYKADGWLGLLIGSSLYFDISTEAKFQQNAPKLITELSSAHS